jgi:hypothetical protein
VRTLYDAVTAANILAADRTPAMVAGYIDRIKLLPWSAADWALFPGAVKVTIVKKASTNDGHVLDVERGDAEPVEAPGWVKIRRAAGADPTVYCNASTWPAVRAAFSAAGVSEPHYWIAKYDGDPTIPAGAVAKQYRGDVAPGYDVSSVVDYWPGVDPAPTNGGTAASSTGELMERITVTPPNAGVNTVRVKLSGTPGAAVVVRPPLHGDGTSDPMWVGNIYAWGSDRAGIGHNPKADPGYHDRMDRGPRRFELPGAVWADIEYSARVDRPFEIDQF